MKKSELKGITYDYLGIMSEVHEFMKEHIDKPVPAWLAKSMKRLHMRIITEMRETSDKVLDEPEHFEEPEQTPKLF